MRLGGGSGLKGTGKGELGRRLGGWVTGQAKEDWEKGVGPGLGGRVTGKAKKDWEKGVGAGLGGARDG